MQIRLENLGTVNKNCVTLGDLTIWFSYETPVGYKCRSSSPVVRENEWGPTTGKLLKLLEPDHNKRVSGAEFMKGLDAILAKIKFDD